MEDQQLTSAVQKLFLARTRGGRIVKASVFWVTLIVMFVIPLGPLVLYFLWRHGDRIAAQTAAAPAPTDDAPAPRSASPAETDVIAGS